MPFAPIRIGSFTVSAQSPPFLIAELSGNHGGSLERALAIVDAAVDAGASAIKLQTYTAETMTLPLSEREFVVSDAGSPWRGRSLHDLYREAHTPWAWHAPIFERCQERGVVAFSSAFDGSSIEFLESLDVPCYKIASAENTDIPLIRRAAATGKPLIISTGMATVEELGEAVTAARAAGCRDLLLLKCTSSYPADPASSHLRTIPHLAELFGCPVGLSDHTLGTGAAIAAVALGAVCVEKHLTLRRADGSVDATFSLEPEEFSRLATECERAWRALGRVHYGPTDEELPSLRYRRSLYVVKDLKAGDALTAESVRAIRPGLGLAPKHLDAVLGRRTRRDVPMGTPLSWDLLS